MKVIKIDSTNKSIEYQEIPKNFVETRFNKKGTSMPVFNLACFDHYSIDLICLDDSYLTDTFSFSIKPEKDKITLSGNVIIAIADSDIAEYISLNQIAIEIEEYLFRVPDAPVMPMQDLDKFKLLTRLIIKIQEIVNSIKFID
jgi:hypothetical protein